MSSRYEWHVLWYDYTKETIECLQVEVFTDPDEAADRLIVLQEEERDCELLPVTPGEQR